MLIKQLARRYFIAVDMEVTMRGAPVPNDVKAYARDLLLLSPKGPERQKGGG